MKRKFKTEWRKRTEAKCARCGETYLAVISEIKRGNGQYCSQLCQRKIKREAKNPHLKKEADRIYLNARRRGDIVMPKVCSVCKSDKSVQGHHDDYAKPLELRFLCGKCHKEWHRPAAKV